ncbi:MAG: hypothetical protein EOO24_18435 [Comamonadaceae bacterium]|nr:MAG: hypothetical protein EOO24_18435 [Comamonadaceae bacterium]
MNHILSAIVLAVLAVLPAVAQDMDAERKRIREERAAADARYETQRRDCHGRFAVTDCLDAARKERATAVADLRRQEVVINDADRKRRAAERLRELDARRAEQSDPDAVARRAKAQADQQERAARAAAKGESQAAQQADRAARAGARREAASGPLVSRGEPRATRAFAAPQPDAAQAARNQREFEARRKDAQDHKAAVLERNAKRTKPPAAGLPTPP